MSTCSLQYASPAAASRSRSLPRSASAAPRREPVAEPPELGDRAPRPGGVPAPRRAEGPGEPGHRVGEGDRARLRLGRGRLAPGAPLRGVARRDGGEGEVTRRRRRGGPRGGGGETSPAPPGGAE